MINHCLFCGSLSVEWPITTPPKIKDVFLCEFHMRFATEKCFVDVYDDNELERCNLYNNQVNKLEEVLHEWAYEFESSYDEISTDIGTVRNEILNRVLELSESVIQIKALKPINTIFSEEEFNNWLLIRIQALAQRNKSDKPMNRCSGFKEKSPDNRCTTYVRENGDLCQSCISSGKQKIEFEQMSTRVQKALEAFWSDDIEEKLSTFSKTA